MDKSIKYIYSYECIEGDWSTPMHTTNLHVTSSLTNILPVTLHDIGIM